MNELPNRVHVDSGSASGVAGGVWRVAGVSRGKCVLGVSFGKVGF